MAYSLTCIIEPNIEPVITTNEISRIGFSSAPYYSVEIEFDKDREYILAIDQSPSCTGIALTTDNFDSIYAFTIFIDDKRSNRFDIYASTLKDFLIRMLQGVRLKYVAYEDVPPTKYKNQDILHEMKGFVKSICLDIDSIKRVHPDHIFSPMPNTWKSFVHDKKDNGPGRTNSFRNKLEISRDITKKMPKMNNYFKALCSMKGHDFDGLEAFGIALACRFIYFSPEWELTNKKMTVQIGKICVVFKYLNGDQTSLNLDGKKLYEAEIPPDNLFWGIAAFGDPSINRLSNRIWNPKYSIYENYIMAANTNQIIILECIETRHILSVLIESNVEYNRDLTLYCLVFKDSIVSDSARSVISENSILVKEYS